MAKVKKISANECIGNSLGTINTNFTTLEDRADKLQKFSNSIVDFVNNGLIFQPVNFDTRSNNTIVLTDKSPKNDKLNLKPWWSDSYIVTIPNIPDKCVGVLIHVYFNTNVRENNKLRFYIKDRNAKSNSDNSPETNDRKSYNEKFSMDPDFGNWKYEAETNVTIPVYLDTTDEKGCKKNTFQWRISDSRLNPTELAPAYKVIIRLLGYYLNLTLDKLA
jgi:hypothetical protein